ncbi:MAG TPA: zinc-ribbon domain-containing protein [Terriglobia bacterium]|nr:zinc-ribbon domain-containing protein [Terriglobia bacterium]
MRCAKCGEENPETNQFCSRCHHPVHFTCPSCKRVQGHGGQCDQCGLDFAKYATMLMFQGKAAVEQERRRRNGRSEVLRQIVLLPITGGWSLLKYLRQSKDAG